MLTFSRELRCIWGRKFSGATLLFFLNRYLTLIYRVLMVVDMLPWQGLPQQTADNVRRQLTEIDIPANAPIFTRCMLQ